MKISLKSNYHDMLIIC